MQEQRRDTAYNNNYINDQMQLYRKQRRLSWFLLFIIILLLIILIKKYMEPKTYVNNNTSTYVATLSEVDLPVVTDTPKVEEVTVPTEMPVVKEVVEEPEVPQPAPDLPLYKANQVSNFAVSIGESLDNRGNKYKKALRTSCQHGAYVIFSPEGKYKYIEGDIATALEIGDDGEICIYDENENLLYSCSDIGVLNNVEHFKVDISGKDLIKIYFDVPLTPISSIVYFNTLIVANGRFTNEE